MVRKTKYNGFSVKDRAARSKSTNPVTAWYASARANRGFARFYTVTTWKYRKYMFSPAEKQFPDGAEYACRWRRKQHWQTRILVSAYRLHLPEDFYSLVTIFEGRRRCQESERRSTEGRIRRCIYQEFQGFATSVVKYASRSPESFVSRLTLFIHWRSLADSEMLISSLKKSYSMGFFSFVKTMPLARIHNLSRKV